jgi:hypothetical protein
MKNWARLACMAVAATILSGCISPYIDTSLTDLKPEDKVSVANPRPVQLLFEFQTNGVVNGVATSQLKSQVWDAVQSSGVFSQVYLSATPSAALLHIAINNIAVTDQAFVSGVATGLTFGLAGTQATDGYLCTIEFLPTADAPKITKVTRDAIYANIGAHSAPPHAEKMPDLQSAVATMTRRVVSNGLNDLAEDPAFPK